MRNKIFFTALFVLTLGLISITAQEQTIKMVTGGVVNGNAVTLVKPAYPAAARAVRAEGAVNVQVTIDEEGNVIAATAVSGHPLLRAAAVEAARASKFKPTMLSGQAVKVTGVIVYNFVAGGSSTTMATSGNWFNTSMMLSALENIPTLRFFQPEALNYKIPAEWSAERDQIKRLQEIKNTEMETTNGDVPKERVIDDRMTAGSEKTSVRTTTMSVTVSPERKVSPEVTAISQSLISSIRGRLAGDELNLWYFNLGISVQNALRDADSRSKDKRSGGAQALRDFINTAPSQISPETVANIEKIAARAEKGIFSDSDRVEMSQLMMTLNTIR